jgi:hypothetical protein
MVKFASRKFIALAIQGFVLVGLPILYKKLEIDDTILMTVLAASSALVGAYTGFNVLQKKYDASPE